MICDNCDKTATVHLTEIVQQYKKESHLCKDCANARGLRIQKPTQDQAPFVLKEFLEKIKPALPEPRRSFPPCPECGITLEDFQRTGRLGCAHDYEHMEVALRPLLEKIHGATQHVGRLPLRIGERVDAEQLLQALERELDEVVAREQYERAAELRDKIRQLREEQA
jgi:protein arginine kinase activator